MNLFIRLILTILASLRARPVAFTAETTKTFAGQCRLCVSIKSGLI